MAESSASQYHLLYNRGCHGVDLVSCIKASLLRNRWLKFNEILRRVKLKVCSIGTRQLAVAVSAGQSKKEEKDDKRDESGYTQSQT